MDWGGLASKIGKAFSSKVGQKALEVGGNYMAGKMLDRGTQKTNTMESGAANRDILAAPTARRDAIAHDENVAGSQAQAGSLANNMADRTANQALKLAILRGASLGGVSAPSFLAGKTGNVSGPQWTPEQLAALEGAFNSGNQNVQTSIDDLRARKTSPLTNLALGAATREDDRQKVLFDQMQQQALESGVLGSKYEKKTPWYQQFLDIGLPIAGSIGAGMLANKFGGGGGAKVDPTAPSGINSGVLGNIVSKIKFG